MTARNVDDQHVLAALRERRSRYSAIEQFRGRPLIAYATSTRQNLQAHMAGDAVREFIDQIERIPAGTKEIDVLLHSSGGDALAAWKLMSVLRERFEKVGVLVPYMAFSAATIFAMGADEIVMHPYASLGPIDPQITVRMGEGLRQFAYEDLGAFLHFLSKEVKLTEQAHFAAVVDKLFSTVDPIVVGAARRASELSAEVGARLLKLHNKDERRCQQIAQNLNKSFFAHGDAVSRSRARDMELAVSEPNPKLEALLWNAYIAIEEYMELRTPFTPLSIVLADPNAAARLQPPGALNLPPDMPTEYSIPVYQQLASQALARAAAGSVSVSYRAAIAVIESRLHASHFIREGTVAGVRLPDGKIQVAMTEKSAGWRALSDGNVSAGGGEETPLPRSRPSGIRTRGKKSA